MSITEEQLRTLFEGCLQLDDPMSPILTAMADDVSITMTGDENPYESECKTKQEVIERYCNRLLACLSGPITGEVRNVLVAGDWRVVEMCSSSTTKNGKPYRQESCMVGRYENGKLVEARIYQDTALTKKLFDENKG
jgi:ketosteroid isomerase-like protein